MHGCRRSGSPASRRPPAPSSDGTGGALVDPVGEFVRRAGNGEAMAEHGAGRHPATTSVDDGVDLSGVLRILARQWFVVLTVLALFVGAAVAYVATTPKTWRAQTRVLLDPRDKQLVGNDLSRTAGSVELGWVETRVELVKAHPTLALVVAREKLVDDPEIMGILRPDDGPAAPAEPAARDATDPLTDRAIRGLADMIVVERPKENSLIDVAVTSRDPEKAARLSRAVADAFVESLAHAKVEQIEQANRLLAAQVDEMRRKMQQAEAKVEEYKRANGIAVTRGSLVDEETLRQSNENLITARNRTQEARERFEHLRQALRNGDIDSIGQADGAGAAVISRLRLDVAAAERRKTEVEQSFGPRHPRTQAAATDLERTRSLVKDELRSLVATAEVDFQIARANEDNLRSNVERAQSRLADTSQATVALQELANEANARRDLYKSFVSRMEETNLQKSTQVSDAVVVSPAQVPQKPFSPRATLALLLAGVAGLGCGLSIALYRGRAALLGSPAAAAPSRPVAPTPADGTVDGAAPPRPAAPATERDGTPPPPPTAAEAAARDRWLLDEVIPALHRVAPNEKIHLESTGGHLRFIGSSAPRKPAAPVAPVAPVIPAAPVPPVPPPIAEEPPAPIVAALPEAAVDVPIATPPAEPILEASAVAEPEAPDAAPSVAPNTDDIVDVVTDEPTPAVATVEPAPAVTAAPTPAPAPTIAPTAPAAAKPAVRAVETERPQRIDLVLLPERIARLGRAPGPGTGVDGALVETADGEPDRVGIALLGRLAGELGFTDKPAACLVFADTMPASISAALCYGLARAETAGGRPTLILDFAEGETPFATLFDAAPRLAGPDRLLEFGDFEIHVDAHDVVLARGSIDAPADAVARFIGAALRDHQRVLVHLGTEPSAALLFDVAEGVDRVVMVAEAERLTDPRLESEIEVMSGLLPGFDRILALSLSGTAVDRPARAGGRRLRRTPVGRGETPA
jgi:uncharacterized protein involved in exopolysaccharide biosynthesis